MYIFFFICYKFFIFVPTKFMVMYFVQCQIMKQDGYIGETLVFINLGRYLSDYCNNSRWGAISVFCIKRQSAQRK